MHDLTDFIGRFVRALNTEARYIVVVVVVLYICCCCFCDLFLTDCCDSKYGLTAKQCADIFSNISGLARFHSLFLYDLEKAAALGPVRFVCYFVLFLTLYAQVFIKYTDFFKMYGQYVNGFEKSLATINAQLKNKTFHKFLADERKSSGASLIVGLLKPRNSLLSPFGSLVLAVQRVVLYCPLLRELRRRTHPRDPEYTSLKDAVAKLSGISEYVGNNVANFENMATLLDIQVALSYLWFWSFLRCSLFFRRTILLL